MISEWLISTLRCATCVQDAGARHHGALECSVSGLTCRDCGAAYAFRDGYVDMRCDEKFTGKETVYNDDAVDLDDPVIRPPVLSAGVRQRVLRLLMRPQPTDAVLDIGCGNGKFAVWNRRAVAHMVGLDPAARFAARARGTVDLVQADARALPFAPGTFDHVYTVDVFEHLDLAGVRDHLRETRRVLTRDGSYFCFSNTRERSWLNRLIDPGRRLSESFHRAGIVDRTRDHLRKGDHVKAVETTDALVRELDAQGFRAATLWYLNPVIATYVETLGIAAMEQAVTRRRKRPDDAQTVSDRTYTPPSVRDAVGARPIVRIALRGLTALLLCDVAFFRRVRTGAFFLLAKPSPRA